MKTLLTLLPLVLGVSAALPTTSIAQDATVYVIHGIDGDDLMLDPDLPVDVSVNGGCAITGFTFGEITDPLSFAPGRYNIQISLADAQNPCSNPPLIDVDVDFFADENATVIAHLDDAFGLTASKFTNDVTPPAGLNARVAVHHTAAAPAVDVTLKRRDFFYDPKLTVAGAANGAQANVDLFYGLWAVRFSAAGSSRTAYGPVNLAVFPGSITQVYAVGSLTNGTANLITLSL